MRMTLRAPLFFSVGVFAIFFGMPSPADAGEGFGMLKKTANLTRIHPPELFISGTLIAVRATSQSAAQASAAQGLQSQAESELISNNPRFKLDPQNPDAVVDVRILQSDYRESWQERLMTRSVKTGSVDSKNRPIYRDEQVNVRFKIVKYTFSSAFKVLDTRANRTLAGDNIDSSFQKEFQNGDGAPDQQSLESDAVQSVVAELTRRLAPTREVVGVLLPKGSFDAISNFADAGLWSKYLDALERMSPLAKPADESYRQYALGVAYEALGYSAEGIGETLKYLEQAAEHYNNAVDANPKEDYFTKAYQGILRSSRKAEAPLTRVQAALVQYQRIKQFEDGGGHEQRPAMVAARSKAADSTQTENAVTNEAIIEMLRAGLPEDVILTSLDSAAQSALDASPRSLIELSNAKASKKLIQRVQALASAAPKKPTPPSSSSKAAASRKQ